MYATSVYSRHVLEENSWVIHIYGLYLDLNSKRFYIWEAPFRIANKRLSDTNSFGLLYSAYTYCYVETYPHYIHTHTHICTHTYMYLYIYIYIVWRGSIYRRFLISRVNFRNQRSNQHNFNIDSWHKHTVGMMSKYWVAIHMILGSYTYDTG